MFWDSGLFFSAILDHLNKLTDLLEIALFYQIDFEKIRFEYTSPLVTLCPSPGSNVVLNALVVCWQSHLRAINHASSFTMGAQW